MKRTSLLKLIALVLLVSGIAADGQYNSPSLKKLDLDQGDSKVIWKGKKPEGEHFGYVKLSDGEILIDNKELVGGSFQFDLNTLTDVDISDKSFNEKLINHLKSPDFFDVRKYPTAQFVITRVSRLPVTKSGKGEIKSTHNIEGDLTIKGITKKISFEASVNLLNGKVTATSLPFTINRKDWNMNYQSRLDMAGRKDPVIFNDITLMIDLVTM